MIEMNYGMENEMTVALICVGLLVQTIANVYLAIMVLEAIDRIQK